MPVLTAIQGLAPIERLMHKPIESLGPQATVFQSVERMAHLHMGAIVIIEHGKLLGIFSERDLLEKVVAKGRDPNRTLVSEAMTTPVQTITPHTSVQEAMQIMQVGRFRHLPVVDNAGQVLGMISLRDVLQEKISDLLLDKIKKQMVRR